MNLNLFCQEISYKFQMLAFFQAPKAPNREKNTCTVNLDKLYSIHFNVLKCFDS